MELIKSSAAQKIKEFAVLMPMVPSLDKSKNIVIGSIACLCQLNMYLKEGATSQEKVLKEKINNKKLFNFIRKQ